VIFLLRSPSATAPALHLAGGVDKILDQAVDRPRARRPDLVRSPQDQTPGKLALLADEPAHVRQLDPQRLIGGDDVVQPVGDLACHARPFERHANAEVSALDICQTPSSTASSSWSVLLLM
jgi:hypothetical protein